jgi:predicted AlkP superfamily pyrophosphatase or phosphodiesterase
MNTSFILLLSFLIYVIIQSSKPKKKCVLLICLDGFSVKLLTPNTTPHLYNLLSKSSYTLNSYVNDITLSGASWASCSKGVWRNKHHFVDNSTPNDYLTSPYLSFITRIKRQQPNTHVSAFVNWLDLINFNIFPRDDCDTIFHNVNDDIVVDAFISYVTNVSSNDNECHIVHLDETDHVGHNLGFTSSDKVSLTEEYKHAGMRIDERVRRLMESLHFRKNYDEEDWMVCITTDHGGIEKDHGDDIWSLRNNWIILHGSSVKKGEMIPSPSMVDIAPTVLMHLGIQQDREWSLDGRTMNIK